MPKLFLIIGGTGSGKTTLVQSKLQLLKNHKKFIFDIQGQYKNFDNTEYNNFKNFIEKIDSVKNSAIVVEEATAFLKHHAVGAKFIEIILSKRHRNNIFFLCFHSLRSVPIDILDFTDYIFLKKTKENPTLLFQKFKEYPEIIEAVNLVRNHTNKYFYTEIIL
jgi:ABC-type dipeptide/oligopeptide/nickel transport system ATPase component